MAVTRNLSTVLVRSGLDRLVSRTWRGLLILNYHRIGTPAPGADPDLYSCGTEDFERQLDLLAERFEIVPAGSADLTATRPARRIAITVDDGYADQLGAARALAARGLPGTFFVCTGFVDEPHHAWWDEIAGLLEGPLPAALPASPWGEAITLAGRERQEVRRQVNGLYKQRAADRGEEFLDWLAAAVGRARPDRASAAKDWMSWDDVRTIRDLGMEIGAHTVSHPVLATLDEERQRAEIAGSVERLEEEVGGIDLFSYPVGARSSFDAVTTRLATEIGIRRSFSFYGGTNDGGCCAHDVRRAGVFLPHTPEVVVAMATVPGVLASPARHA
ncbi:polysaccharide deacetylase family protein [Pseudonocardia ailaonensis]|uniref:Polysaccharide deacetylase family protein n=1 Tax=Pseudonocardia ailaonensis TaxID=367279 RepID=A0ABN2NEW6_9PSEU